MKNFLLYLFLIVVAVIYIRMVFEIWKYRKEQKSEWERYWDEVFEQNKKKQL